MTKNHKNPVTDNVGTGQSENVTFIKVVSASAQCGYPFYGRKPPHYRAVKCNNEQSLIAALRRVLNVANGSGDAVEEFLKKSKLKILIYGKVGNIVEVTMVIAS